MNNMEWTYFVFGVIAWQILKMLYVAIDHQLRERRERRFLKLVSIAIPDHKDITLIALDTSDRRAFQRLEKELRERFNLDEEEESGSVRFEPHRRPDR